jgi:uncharacterized protein (DUF2336 family)
MLPEKSPRRYVDASLLRAVVDQFVGRPTHPVGDIRQFERLALGLIDIVEPESVALAARPLCFHPETPPAIFARLLEKGDACAALALEFTSAPSHADLIEIAKQGAPALACAIARRRDLDREIVEALAHRGDSETLRVLAANWSAHLDAASRRALVRAARDDLALARTLLDRDDAAVDPEPLFLAANGLERTGIVLSACRRALSEGLTETRRADPVLVARLEAAAVSRDRDAMAAILSQYLECRKDRARAIVLDPHGEALALALAALGYDVDAATRIFLCADPQISHDTDRVRALVALLRSTPQRAAAQIIAAVAGSAKSEADGLRRTVVREEAFTGSGRRRAAPRNLSDSVRKWEQSG